MVIFLAVLMPVGTVSAGTQPATAKRIEKPTTGLGTPMVSRHSDSFALPAASASVRAGLGGIGPFLTRPYWGWHSLNSYFDHCNPDYTIDGRICTVDGVVALKSNGVDPSFTKGYAVTPHGTDYIYYDGHNGYDIGLTYEELIAAAPGSVTTAGIDPVPYNSCYGQTVVIDHGNGFSTRYAHMSQVDVSTGQVVQRGQHLGVSGTSGCSTGPHLHFSTYSTATWNVIDPWGWLGAPAADPWPYDAGNLWITGNPKDPLPSEPTAVTAAALDSAAMVTWQAPSFDGGSGITSYTVTASPGGATVTSPGTTPSAHFPGLTNFTAYTFTVTASDAVGTGPASAASAPVTPQPQAGGPLNLVQPTRLLDTRQAGSPIGTLAARQTVDVQIAGQAGIPTSGVSAALLNITVVNPQADGYLTAYPSGGQAGNTSNLNHPPGQTVANLAFVATGANGRVSLLNSSAGSVDLVVDVQGWFSNGSGAVGAGRIVPLTPSRLADSRLNVGSGPLVGAGSSSMQVTGRAGIPSTGVAGVVVNLTVTDTTSAGFVTAYGPTPRPGTSNVNYDPGVTVANRVVVPVDPTGKINLYNGGPTAVDFVIDVSAWISDGSDASISGGLMAALPAYRLLDTRLGAGPLAANASVSIPVAGHSGVPATGARTVIVNLTVTDEAANGFLTVYPGSTPPLASDLNFQPLQTIANLVLIKIGPSGSISVFNASMSPVNVVVDLLAWGS